MRVIFCPFGNVLDKGKPQGVSLESIMKTEGEKTKAGANEETKETDSPFDIAGERARLSHGLSSMPAKTIVNMLKALITTDEGTRKVAAVLPATSLPKQVLAHCLRCDKDFDPQYNTNKSCIMDHPGAAVEDDGDDEGGSVGRCARCDGIAYTENEWHEETIGPPCFMGQHTLRQDLVDGEGWKQYKGCSIGFKGDPNSKLRW